MILSNAEYLILKELFRDPILPYNKLANLVGLSPPTVKKKIEGLLAKNIIKSFYGEYYPEAIGLESHMFLLRVQSVDKLRLVERIIDFFPYLVSRSRCYGSISGIYVKVHLPLNSLNRFMFLLDYLSDANLIAEIIPSSTIGRGIKTHTDLTYWDQNTGNWTFGWHMWEKNIDMVDYIPQFDYFQKVSSEKPKNVLKHMHFHDFELLRELVSNPVQKHILLAKKIGLPPYNFSRRVKFLNEYVIRKYMVDFDRSFFGLEDDFVFKAICSPRAMAKIIYLMHNLDLPFKSDFRNTERGFLWKILLPPKDKLGLINILWSLFPDLQIMMRDPHEAAVKPFNPNNYSFMDHSWKDSEEYMVDQVLEMARGEFILA